MTTTTPALAPARRGGRPPPWRDVRVLAWVFQFAVLAVAVFIVSWLWDNLQVNSQRQNIPTSFDYLDQPAGFPIANSAFRQTQPVHAALVVGLLNTLRLAVVGIVLATVFGTLLGVARLSKNFLVRKAAQVYVETVRNVPLLGIIILIYLGRRAEHVPGTERRAAHRTARRHQRAGRDARVLRGRHVEVPGGRRRARPQHVGGRRGGGGRPPTGAAWQPAPDGGRSASERSCSSCCGWRSASAARHPP